MRSLPAGSVPVVKTRRSSRIPDCSYSFDFHGAKLVIFCEISKFFGEFFEKKSTKNSQNKIALFWLFYWFKILFLTFERTSWVLMVGNIVQEEYSSDFSSLFLLMYQWLCSEKYQSNLLGL